MMKVSEDWPTFFFLIRSLIVSIETAILHVNAFFEMGKVYICWKEYEKWSLNKKNYEDFFFLIISCF